jgi:hypothetical protein
MASAQVALSGRQATRKRMYSCLATMIVDKDCASDHSANAAGDQAIEVMKETRASGG